jgi:hypothetical protein
MTKDEALKLCDYLECNDASLEAQCKAAAFIRQALAQPEQPTIKQSLTVKQKPILRNIEQYRLQMAGISTAAFGYWKEGDGIHPDYDTVALRDVAKLYSKYDALYKARWSAQPEQEPVGKWMGKEVEWTENPYKFKVGQSIYTTPPKRQWVGLTDGRAAS